MILNFLIVQLCTLNTSFPVTKKLSTIKHEIKTAFLNSFSHLLAENFEIQYSIKCQKLAVKV